MLCNLEILKHGATWILELPELAVMTDSLYLGVVY